MADATDTGLDDIEAERQRRYEESRRSAEQIAARERIDAAGYQPPGSPTQFLGRGSQLLGPRATDEFNIPLPIPRGAVGLRGYPSADEYAAASANDAAQAKQNQLDSDISSVSQRYPSAPKFAMPSTDQLIDAGIQAKRDAIQNEINDRLVHFGKLPPSAIGASAVTLYSDQPTVAGRGRHGQIHYGASEGDQKRAELAILQHSAANLDRAQAGVIQQNSRLALVNAKQNESYAQDVARGQVVDFLNGIDETRYPHGSPDRQAFIGKVFGNRPDWLHVMAKDKDLSKYVTDHLDAQDKVASTIAQLRTLYPDLEVTPKSITSKGAVTYGVGASPEDKAASKDQAKLVARLHSQTGLSPEEFAAISEDNAKAGGIFVPKPGTKAEQLEGTFYHQGGGFNANGTPKGEFDNRFQLALPGYKPGTQITPEDQKKAEERIASGTAIQLDTGKGYKSVIPRTHYEQYRKAFAQDNEGQTTGKKVMSVDDWLNQ